MKKEFVIWNKNIDAQRYKITFTQIRICSFMKLIYPLKNHWLPIVFILLTGGCSFFPKPAGKLTPTNAMEKVGLPGNPDFSDDLDKSALIAAIEKNNIFLDRLPQGKVFTYGHQKISLKELKESYRHFISILKESNNNLELNSRIKKDFDIFRSVGSGHKKRVLFTGYYEPVMKGSKVKTSYYKYPIYSKPDDLVNIDLGDFSDNFKGKRIVARIENGSAFPYYNRKSIDSSGSLSGRGLEIAWLSDPVDLFFLHIQGSGIIEMFDGDKLNVNYAAANGRRYRSIGRLLIEEGKVPKELMSMKAIREYLTFHPEEVDRVLFYNESYVFFRTVPEGPIGSAGVPLTAARSIAVDTSLFPKGGLAYIETEIPVTDDEGNILSREKIARFVVIQDTGGAIKGPGRVDIFFGSGREAGNSAGAMNREGKLFFLIKKSKKSF